MNQTLHKITAIVRSSVLEQVERRLRELYVPGISVTRVKGYGEYVNAFKADWTSEHVRIEVFCCGDRSEEIAQGIVESAKTGLSGDGIVVVQPIEAVYRVRNGQRATAEELGGCQRAPHAGATKAAP